MPRNRNESSQEDLQTSGPVFELVNRNHFLNQCKQPDPSFSSLLTIKSLKCVAQSLDICISNHDLKISSDCPRS